MLPSQPPDSEPHRREVVPSILSIFRKGVKSQCLGFGDSIRIRKWRCHGRTVKLAADSQPRPDPNEKLVKVFDSEQEIGGTGGQGLARFGGNR